MDRIKNVFDVFTKVVTCTMIGSAAYCLIFFSDATLPVSFIWQLLLCSLLTSLGTLLYTDSSLKVTIIKCFIHYLWVNIVVVGCGIFFDWFNPNNFVQLISMLVLVAVVFLLVSAITWRKAFKMAQLLNDRLKDYQNQSETD